MTRRQMLYTAAALVGLAVLYYFATRPRRDALAATVPASGGADEPSDEARAVAGIGGALAGLATGITEAAT